MAQTNTVYRNRHNPNKHIEITHYRCGHYAVAQYIKSENPVTGETIVYTGTRKGKRRLRRWRLRDINQFLGDYIPV